MSSYQVPLELYLLLGILFQCYFINSMLLLLEPLDLIKPSEKNEKIVVLWGTLVKLECVAVGFPLPTTTMWFENNLIEPTRSSRRRLPSVSRTTVATADVAGHYQCNTVGYYLSPDGGDVLYSSVKHFYLEVYGKYKDPVSIFF